MSWFKRRAGRKMMEVSEVKRLLRIEGTAHDDYLAAVLPLVIEHVKAYCNQDFTDGLPGGVRLAVAKWCQAYMKEAGVQSETLARHSVTYSVDQMPAEVRGILNNYRRPFFVAVRGGRNL